MSNTIFEYKFICDGCQKEEIVEGNSKYDTYWFPKGWKINGRKDYCGECGEERAKNQNEQQRISIDLLGKIL